MQKNKLRKLQINNKRRAWSKSYIPDGYVSIGFHNPIRKTYTDYRLRSYDPTKFKTLQDAVAAGNLVGRFMAHWFPEINPKPIHLERNVYGASWAYNFQSRIKK